MLQYRAILKGYGLCLQVLILLSREFKMLSLLTCSLIPDSDSQLRNYCKKFEVKTERIADINTEFVVRYFFIISAHDIEKLFPICSEFLSCTTTILTD